MNIPILIPAYEPDDRLLALLAQLRAAQLGPVILVNDGSGKEYDAYYEAAQREFGCTVLRHAVNLGKGRALKTAFNYVLAQEPQALGVITADSDGQHTVPSIKACRDALWEHPHALILGVRDFDRGEDIPWKSTFGNKLTRRICKFLCGLDISDTQTGLRGIPRAFMEKLMNTPGERFEFETRMLIETVGVCPICEVPIETVYDSKENHATHFDPVRDSIRIYKIFGMLFLKYILSSLSSSGIDLVLFWLFCSAFKGAGYGYYVAAATVLARVLSAAYNYGINYKFVFSSAKSKKISAGKYAVLAAVQMCASALLVTAGTAAFRFLPELVVKIVVDTVLFFVSYSIQRRYIF